MIQGKKSILIFLISLSLLMAVYEIVLFINSFESSKYFSAVYSFVYIILVIMWVDIDSNLLSAHINLDFPRFFVSQRTDFTKYYFRQGSTKIVSTHQKPKAGWQNLM